MSVILTRTACNLLKFDIPNLIFALITLAKFHVNRSSISRVIAQVAWGGGGGVADTLHMQLRQLVIITQRKQEMKTEILMNYLEKEMQWERERVSGYGCG